MLRINPFIYNYPTLDLHGEIESMVEVLVNKFIDDNVLLNHKDLVIIHGKGKLIVKNKLYEVLKDNKLVKKYGIDINNDGATIVNLK